jgi:hypothetical protein
MHSQLVSKLQTAACALGALACLITLGCGDGALHDAVATGHALAPSAAVAAESPASPVSPARAAATTPQQLPATRLPGSAALHEYRQDVDASHAAIGSYFE